MPDTIVKAAVCREFGGALCVEDVALPPIGAREVRARVMACAVCHSDIIYMDGGWGGHLPCVFGHEAAGIVVESGKDSGVAVGASVVITLLRSCDACLFCEKGAPALCAGKFPSDMRLQDAKGEVVSAGLKTAAFAEQVVVHESQVAPIDDGIPFDEASLLACGVLTGWGAVVNNAQVTAGSSVAVVGCGGVGANCLQAAAMVKAEPVVAVDLSADILQLATNFGATTTCEASKDIKETAQQVRAANNGRGFDFVFMAAGSARAVELSAELVAPLGALVLVGMPPDGDLAKLDATNIAYGQRRILGSKMGGARLREDIPKLLALRRSGELKLAELIAARRPLSQINDAVNAARGGGVLRNVVVFD